MHDDPLSLPAQLREFRRPWKLALLGVGTVLLIIGSRLFPAPDWDVPISLIMAALAYLCAPWSLRVLVQRRWRYLPVALLLTWFSVDGCYWLYWRWQDPRALQWMRQANALASLTLYGVCALVWYFRGSLRELLQTLQRRKPDSGRSGP